MTVASLGRLGRLLCLGGAASGATGLTAWLSGAFGMPASSGLSVMTPSTALALVLVGIAAAVRRDINAPRLHTTLAVVTAGVVLALCSTTLIEHGLGVDLHINRLLISSAPDAAPARPALLTASGIILLALAVILIDARPTARVRPSEWFELYAALIAFTALIGIIFGTQPLYESARAPVGLTMATAGSLLLISIGLLLERPTTGVMRVATSRGPGGILLRRCALPTILVPVVLGLVLTRVGAFTGIEGTAVPLSVMAAAFAAAGLVSLIVTAFPIDRVHTELDVRWAQTRSLIERAPDGILIADPDERLSDINEAGCRILRYARHEIIGKAIPEIVAPEDLDRISASREVLLRKGVHVGEWRLRRGDGTYVPTEVSATVLPDGRWQGVVRDISERKRLEEEQKRIENEQRFLAEIGTALANTLDYEGTLSHIVEIAVRNLSDLCILDLIDSQGQLRRLRVASRDRAYFWMCDLLRGAALDRARLVMTALESRQPILVQHARLESIGAIRPGDYCAEPEDIQLRSAIVVPLVAHGRVLGAMSFLSVTSLEFAEEDVRVRQQLAERAALAVENARLYSAAQRAIQVRDDIVGIVAHDLRNPLAAILIEAALLRRGLDAVTPDTRESVEAIERVAMRMNRLIEDLLDGTRIEAGQLVIEPGRVSALDVVRDALELHCAVASSRELELRLSLPEDLPDVWADRGRLLQVFDNLLGNAVKFTPPGGRITIGAEPQESTVLFWVADTGVGIPYEHQPYLFDRFWQARPAGRSGAGLGLPIVKGIVEAHGGEVTVKSVPAQGSSFSFTIPISGTTPDADAGSKSSTYRG
jgi:PAS domain S-box-containing protein